MFFVFCVPFGELAMPWTAVKREGDGEKRDLLPGRLHIVAISFKKGGQECKNVLFVIGLLLRPPPPPLLHPRKRSGQKRGASCRNVLFCPWGETVFSKVHSPAD